MPKNQKCSIHVFLRTKEKNGWVCKCGAHPNGQDCICYAWDHTECGCPDVDWTTIKECELLEENRYLKAKIKEYENLFSKKSSGRLCSRK